MENSEKRRLQELVDAVVVGMSDSNEDELFEAFINRPESICDDDLEKQKLLRRSDIESALESRLDEDGRRLLSQYSDVIEDYWGELGRCFFNIGVRLGRLLERQRTAERMLVDLESRKRSGAEVRS